jgi:sulfur carrier protein
MSVAVVVNGERRILDGGGIAGLLRSLGHDPHRAGIAVAINDEVVPRAQWSGREIVVGDRIEVVGAVQGG